MDFDNVSRLPERVKKLIFFSIPMSICNFRCHYCYLAQRPVSYQGIQPEMKYSPEQVAKALSFNRLGGQAYLNICADGETLITKDLDLYVKRLVEEGHYAEIVSNCTITAAIEKYLAWDAELRAHVEFKCSFHYLELKKRNMLDLFVKNINRMWDAGISTNIEVTPSDELIPHIDELKEFSLKNFGALPHVTIARNDRTKNIEILSKLPRAEYYKLWGQFDSAFFNYKTTIFGKPQEEFCYGGLWSIYVNLCTGQAQSCYCGRALGDIFANPETALSTYPVGICTLPHCYNGHAFLTWGNIPHATNVRYSDVRNRVRADGTEWLHPKLKNFFSTRLCENNAEITDSEKYDFMVKNLLGLH